MKRFHQLLQKPEFRWLLALAMLLVMSWPSLTKNANHGLTDLYAHYFIAWAIVVFILWAQRR